MSIPIDSFMGHLETEPPPTLYHYTSLDVFRKIVEAGRIWASDVRYLNDSTEYSHVINIIESRIQEHLLKPGAVNNEKSLRQLSHFLLRGSTSDLFVSCFSTKRDDLSQWRGYSPHGIGVCIGFNSKALQAAIKPNPPHNVAGILGEVRYISKDYAPRCDQMIDLAIQLKPPRKLSASGPSFVSGILNFVAPFFKHASFSEEREWRILFSLSVEADTKFRQGKSTLIPYREVDLRTAFPTFISEVIIGPSPNMQLSIKATNKVLQVAGMDYVTVHESTVPYRNW